VVFAKAPEPGRVKTRLCPPLTPESAAALQEACLLDLWDRIHELSVSRILCHDPTDSAGRFQNLLGEEADLLAQSPGDLGLRLVAAFDALFARGFSPVAAVGADSPDLPLVPLTDALEALEAGRCEVALGPAEDGGYTLVALRGPYPEPFEAIPWSTDAVFVTTVGRCRAAGLRVLTLAPWYDVDDATSLARLRASVCARPNELPRLYRLFEAIKDDR
jgi:rSAM/selenodomain-associated transferase 1